MNILVTCFVLVGVPSAFIVGGYWIAARLSATTSTERVALAALIGLCLFVWNVSILGFLRPISGPSTWICLWPVLLSAFDSRARGACRRDFSAVVFNHRGAVALLSIGLFFTTLLWPLLSRPELIFYDGTSNHDAFFWVSGAEFLRDHTYMVEPVKSAVQPFTNGVGVFSGGWFPMWGRMSSEGLLALITAVTRTPPLQLYVPFTAALFIPWIAAVYLVARTFLVRQLGVASIVALCFAQPLFLFFQSNANLPNLLGALTGALLVVATERCLRLGPDRFGWLVIVALGLHGLLCSYPEMSPFILLPVALLVSRRGFSAESPNRMKAVWPVLLAGLVGLALNPATTIRAGSGFYRAFSAARVDEIWPKLFERLSLSEYIPALASLTMNTSNDLGVITAGLCSVLILSVAVSVLWRAHDRLGASCILTGGGVLLLYTITTHFNYGWQKSAQFSGVFIAAILPLAAIEFLSRASSSKPASRFLTQTALVCCSLFFVYATARNCFESHKWSRRKYITTDWLAVREYAREKLHHAPVLIDAPSFSTPYFNGMWALYFLADSYPIFTERGTENGGYLHDYTRVDTQVPEEAPQAFLVSARWADSFDANSPRLITGRSVALLSKMNRVNVIQGFSPKNGVPDFVGPHLVLEITPHSTSRLEFELALPAPYDPRSVKWIVNSTINQAPALTTEVSGPAPWRFTIPLTSDQRNRIEIRASNPSSDGTTPFTVTNLKILRSNKP